MIYAANRIAVGGRRKPLHGGRGGTIPSASAQRIAQERRVCAKKPRGVGECDTADNCVVTPPGRNSSAIVGVVNHREAAVSVIHVGLRVGLLFGCRPAGRGLPCGTTVLAGGYHGSRWVVV